MRSLLFLFTAAALAGISNAELISYWNLNEGSGSVANDLQNNFDGTLYGPSWTSGKFGNGLSFDGYNDRVDVGDYSRLEYFNQVTLATWVYWTGSTGEFLVGKEWVYKIDIVNSKIRFLTGNAWAGGILTSNTTLSKNTWYHIAAVYDGTQKRLYFNGVQDLNIVNTTGSMNYSIWPVTMGAQPLDGGGFEDYFTGRLDDVRIYNSALTQEQIQALMVPEPVTGLLLAFGLLFTRKQRR